MLDVKLIERLRLRGGYSRREFRRLSGMKGVAYGRFLLGANHRRLTLGDLDRMAKALGVSPSGMFPRTSEASVEAQPDDVKLEAALAEAGKLLTREQLARSLNWDLVRLRRAKSSLSRRLAGSGQCLAANTLGLALRPAPEALTDDERKAVSRFAVPLKGLRLPVAQLLRRIIDGSIDARKIEGGHGLRVTLERLIKLGYVVYDGGEPRLSSEVALMLEYIPAEALAG